MLVVKDGVVMWLYVDFYVCVVLGGVVEELWLMWIVVLFYGMLLVGWVGSWIVEIVVCWMIMMLLIGLYLWWLCG